MSNASHQSLARLLHLELDNSEWNPQELSAILEHQMRAPLVGDLGRSAPGQMRTVAELTQAGNGARTFGELLAHESPSAALLYLIKDFAKSSRVERDGALPAKVATALYYAAIVAARVRLNERISELDDVALRQGIEWALREPWIGQPIRGHFESALESKIV